MTKIYKIYTAHSMEGLTPEQSIKRPLDIQKVLYEICPGRFECIIPEHIQEKISVLDIYTKDIKALKMCDIVVADLYNLGLLTPRGKKLLESKLEKGKVTPRDMKWLMNNHTTKCLGTIEEVGHAKALGKYVVVIVRSDTKHHPFHYGADYIASSVEDACQHLKEKFGR